MLEWKPLDPSTELIFPPALSLHTPKVFPFVSMYISMIYLRIRFSIKDYKCLVFCMHFINQVIESEHNDKVLTFYFIFPLALLCKYDTKALHIIGSDTQWIRPLTLNHLLEIKNCIPDVIMCLFMLISLISVLLSWFNGVLL